MSTQDLFLISKTPLTINDTAFIADFNVGAAIRKKFDTDVNEIISLAEAALRKSKSNRHVNFTLLSDDTHHGHAKGLALKSRFDTRFEQ